MITQTRSRIIIGFVLTVAAIVAVVWKLNQIWRVEQPASVTASATPLPSAVPPIIITASPLPTPSTSPAPALSPLTTTSPDSNAGQGAGAPPTEASPLAQAESFSSSQHLIIPVAGIRADQLQDTFTAARSEGRVHDAIDIIAPHNTPVLAAADGPIVKLFQSERGGITIYQESADGKTVFYYAHLDRYADGLAEGHVAHQGEVIAYVGDTGNAGAGNYHLHFSVSLIGDPKHFFNGTSINPYPLLTQR
jgi:murein DD-endopeptidase MepM/ murein hydrolase activator NlpD